MRIVGGKYRGRKLNRVEKKTTRETADMVKESIFNMLGGKINGIVLDLFAGSGAYGLEAISRGGLHLYAIDHDKDAIKTIIANAKLLDETRNVTIFHKDYHHFIESMESSIIFDCVFIDPPYDLNVYEEVISHLSGHLNQYAYIICESSKKTILPKAIGEVVKIKERVYGIKLITIYQKQ